MADFSIVSPRGDVLPLGTSATDTSPFGLLSGSKGLGLAPRDVTMATSSTDGSRVRAQRVAAREGTLGVLVSGVDAADRLANVRRLAAAVRSLPDLPAPVLQASTDDGLYTVSFVYTGGAEDLEPDANDGSGVIELDLDVTFPDPFWTAVEATTFSVMVDPDTRGLLPDLAKLQVKASGSSGSIAVTNPGDAAAPAVWRLVGPATSVSATLPNGRGWAVTSLAQGEVVTIDTAAATVTFADGSSAYSRMAPAPKLFSIPTGTTTIAVDLEGGVTGSSAVCYFCPRLEVVL